MNFAWALSLLCYGLAVVGNAKQVLLLWIITWFKFGKLFEAYLRLMKFTSIYSLYI
jgi:hypothetical protein